MDSVETNRANHAEKLITFGEKYAPDLVKVPAINGEIIPEIKQHLTAAYNQDIIAVQDNSGTTDDKQEKKEELIKQLDLAVGAYVAFADDKNDEVSAATIDFPISTISTFRGSRLYTFGLSVQKKILATGVLAELKAKYNYPDEGEKNLAVALKDYEAVLDAPQDASAESVAAGKMVEKELDAIDDLIEKLRRKMRPFRQTNINLFTIFEAYDTIDDYGGGKSSGGKTTLNGSIAKSEILLITAIAYNADLEIELENVGTVAIDFQLYLSGNPVGKSVTLASKSKLSTQLSALANEGDAIYAKNNSSTTTGAWVIKF